MATKCPYGCKHCRAIELGLDHRALTQAEQILLSGGLAEQPNGHRVVWSAETADAAAAVDVAQAARDEAYKTFTDLIAALNREGTRRGGRKSDHYQELEEAAREAKLQLEEAEERLREPRAAYYKLAQRDSRNHAIAEFQAGQEEQARAREESKKSSRKSGRKTLERLRGQE